MEKTIEPGAGRPYFVTIGKRCDRVTHTRATARPHRRPTIASTIQSQEAASVREALDRTRRLSTHLFRLLQNRLGCTRQQVDVLAAIHDGAVRLNQVAAATGLHVSGTSRLVDGMVGDGLLHRHPDPEDRRAVVLQLTPEGEQLHDQARLLIGRIVEHAIARMPNQSRSHLPEVLDQFLDAAEMELSEGDI
ncbi:MAG: MarR family winged helix-turn-helix transcriptional regulator [Nitriliruptoraceae bacterium]